MADLDDYTYGEGQIGLYDRANAGAEFDDVVIESFTSQAPVPP
jgi:hypothetical protein